MKRRMMTWDFDPDKQPSQRVKRQKRSVRAYEEPKKALYDTSEDEKAKSSRTARPIRRRKAVLPKVDEVFADNTIPKDTPVDVEAYRKKLRANMDVLLASIRATHAKKYPDLYKSSPQVINAPSIVFAASAQDEYVALSDISDEYEDDFESEDYEEC